MTIKTGDLVKTCNSWEGYITLGIAYKWNDLPKTSNVSPSPEYVYVLPIAGQLLTHPDFCPNSITGGYKPENLTILNSLEG